MKILKPSTQYKKDFKRILNNPNKLSALRVVLDKLQYEQPIPPENKPHMLTGDYAGCMECHIEGDFLLIWIDPNTDKIGLVRLGSHSELFGKGKKR
ncbi:MAG: type II toxin-antitoxin system YafQ family toxin [Muribaculaceae bacterium]|nr:type II toxin-antitoxin system YafQ family toxin [Muribaculaceae bacterium]